MPHIPPPWLTPPVVDAPPAPDAPPARTAAGQFAPGVSGNPSGKAPGRKSKRTLLAQQFEDGIDDIVRVVKQLARDGDMQAASLVLSRALPPKRAVAERVEFDLDASAPRHVQAQQIVTAVAAGELDSDAAKTLMDVLTAAAGLEKLDLFAQQLADVQAQLAKLNRSQGGTGVAFDTEGLD